MTRSRLLTMLPRHAALKVGLLHVRHVERTPSTVHPHAAISLVVAGTGQVWCGATYALQAGDLLLIPEGAPHHMQGAQDLSLVGLAACTSCLRDGNGPALVASLQAVSEGACALLRLSPEEAGATRWVLDRLAAELTAHRPETVRAIDACLGLLVAIIARASSQSDAVVAEVAPGGWVSQALAFASARATHGVGLAEVAKHVGRSPAHVASTVRAATGRTLTDWITQSRLAAARHLLLQTDETIEAIAQRVGYASASQFHRTFRRVHGAPPAAWRTAHARMGAVGA